MKRHLVKYGRTEECQASTQLSADAEIAVASSWRQTTTRGKASECRHEQSQTLVKRRSGTRHQSRSHVPRGWIPRLRFRFNTNDPESKRVRFAES